MRNDWWKAKQGLRHFLLPIFFLFAVGSAMIAAKKGSDSNHSASFKLPVWILGNGGIPQPEVTLGELKIVYGKSLLEPTNLKKPESCRNS
jgi:hypothetical protein